MPKYYLKRNDNTLDLYFTASSINSTPIELSTRDYVRLKRAFYKFNAVQDELEQILSEQR